MCSNYRPISTLHLISKVFEKIMYSRLSAFLDKYDVLYSNQFGFRRGRSTDDAVLQFTDEVYNAFNKNKYLVAVMLDLSKHLILCKVISCWASWNALVSGVCHWNGLDRI